MMTETKEKIGNVGTPGHIDHGAPQGASGSLTENQRKRVRELKKYLDEIKVVERNDFDQWFEGKKTFAVNVGAWLLLIEDDQ